MRIQRFNSGTMRRYHFPNGSVLVCDAGKARDPRVIPAWCGHISAPIGRNEAAISLRQLRAMAKGQA